MATAQEIRFAARMLAKNKGWTGVAALALALGLGANVAIFSIVRLMLWPPLPYPQPEQLVYVPQTNAAKGFRQASVSLQDTRDWATGKTVQSLAACRSRPFAVSGQGEPAHLAGMQVTPEFFPALGVRPLLGRDFTAAESPENEARVAVISHELWQGMFNGETAVLGREIRLDGRNYAIVGVMPEGFHFLYQRTDVWTPLALDPAQRARGWRSFTAVGRLQPGVTPQQASAEVRAISERVEREHPKDGEGWRGTVLPLSELVIHRKARSAGTAMFAAVAFVLLIACANVASLLLARGTQRRRELAVRASLGAGRGALIRLLLSESLLLSLLGGALGVLSAVWTIPVLKRTSPPDMPILQTASLDWNALWFGLAVSVSTGVLFGVVPALLLTRGNIAAALHESSRGSSGGRHRVLQSLVAGELALALVLVAASTLMICGAIRAAAIDPGFDKSNLTAAHVLLSTPRYPESRQVAGFFSSVLENLRRDGSVESAALTETIPLGGSNNYLNVRVEGGDARQDNIAGSMVVSPGYFRTMRIGLAAGRDFTDADTDDAPKVAIVNQRFLARYWPKEAHPIGRRLKLGADQSPWLTVIGVAHDVLHVSLDDPPRPEVYCPHAQAGNRAMIVVARGRGPSRNLAGALRAAVRQVDREQPLFRIQSVESYLLDRRAGPRATTRVIGVLSVVALLLAAVGAYGVMSYTAGQRIREIGIRLALGASRRNVFRMVIARGAALGAIGVGIGLPAAYAVAPVLRSFTTNVDARDSAAYTGVAALLLLAVALAACVVPAWRAMRVDPAGVLRAE